MPALPNVPQVLRIQLRHSFAGDDHLGNRFYMQYTGGAPTDADCHSIGGGVWSSWDAHIKSLANADVSLEEVTVTDLTTPSAGTGNWVESDTGTRSGQSLTVNDCVALNFQIQRRYRGGKPRLYGPWGVEADLATQRTWSSAFITEVDTAWTNFIDAIETTFSATTLAQQVNVSYYHGFLPVENPVSGRYKNVATPRPSAVVDAIASHSAGVVIGSQRRRNRAV